MEEIRFVNQANKNNFRPEEQNSQAKVQPQAQGQAQGQVQAQGQMQGQAQVATQVQPKAPAVGQKPEEKVVVTQMPPARKNKIVPVAVGICLAVIAGVIVYRLTAPSEEEMVAEATPVPELDRPQVTLETAPVVLDELESNRVTPVEEVVISDTASERKTVLQVPQVTAQTATQSYNWLKGTVNVTGEIEGGSSVLVMYRPVSQSEFTTGPRLDIANERTWQITTNPGEYEVKLVWQINGADKITSQTVTVNTGANITTNFSFNVSSSDTGSVNPGYPSLSSCYKLEDNIWKEAKIFLPGVEKATAYQVEIGTSSGANDVYNHIYQQSEQVLFQYGLENHKDYYVRYRVQTSETGDSWSDWSSVSKMRCAN